MNFEQLVAKFICGHIPPENISAVGIAGIEEGYDSPSLYILAGLNENWVTTYEYVKKTLGELNLQIPDKRKSALIYAAAITDHILQNRTELIEGVKELFDKAIGSYDFNAETTSYVYDSIFLENLYGLYDDYDDLTSIYIKREDKEVVEEIKFLMLEELAQWHKKISFYLESDPL